MAAPTTSNVTVLDSWTEGGVAGKRHLVKRVRFAGTNLEFTSLSATLFGLKKVEWSSDVFDVATGNHAHLTGVPVAGDVIYVYAESNGGLPVAYGSPNTIDWLFTVKGY